MMYPQQVKRRESNAEERQIDSDIEYNLDKAREQLNDLLKNKEIVKENYYFVLFQNVFCC